MVKKPEFGLIDTILEMHPELFVHLKEDIVGCNKISEFGRKDIPGVEQIVRAAIYKELKQLEYRELEYQQEDSRICVQFGHKINLTTGKSNLVLSCEILRGNPSDSALYPITLDKVIADYQVIPRDCVTDGGYASLDNRDHAQKEGVVNIVFNKIVGSLKNTVSSLNMETRLKKWRSGISI